MRRLSRNALAISTVASVIFVVNASHAASVVWTIDSTATSLGATATGLAPVGGITLPARLVVQGTNPLPSLTPTIPIKISGVMVTDTDFTASIKFLKTGTLEGETTGDFKPLSDGTDGTAPSDVGFTAQAKIGSTFFNAVDGSIRGMVLDFSGPDAIAITGGSFPTTKLSTSIIDGRIDYRGYGTGSPLGSGSEALSLLLPGDANFDRIVNGGDYTIWADNYLDGDGHKIYTGDFSGDGLVNGADYTLWADHFLESGDPFPSVLNTGADATITSGGGFHKLTIPILSVIAVTLDEGDNTDSTSDNIFVNFKIAGSVIATTPIPASATAVPEPSSLVLAIVAGLGMGFVALCRKLRQII